MRLSPQPSETFLAPSLLYSNNRLHGELQATNINSRNSGGHVCEFQEHSTLSRRSAHFEKHPLNTFKLGGRGLKTINECWRFAFPTERLLIHEQSWLLPLLIGIPLQLDVHSS